MTQDRELPLWMVMLKNKIYFRIPILKVVEIFPAVHLLPYASYEAGITEKCKKIRMCSGVGITLISTLLKLDFYFNLYSRMEAGEKESQYGVRFTIE